MGRTYVSIFLWSLFLLVFQLLVLNNVYLWGFINPYIYIFIILMLPMDFRPWAGLMLGFSLGLILDIFTDTLGLHTAATLTMTFFRPMVLRLISPREGYESDARPDLGEMGFSWYLRYAGFLVFIHHFLLFYLEVFRFSGFFQTFARMLFSWLASMILIFLFQFLIQKPQK